MDTPKTAPRVTLKLPLGPRTVRITALDASQMVGLSLFDSSELTRITRVESPDSDDASPRPLPVMYEIMKQQCGEGEWDAILRDVALGRTAVADVIGLFGALVRGSTEAIKAAAAKPEPKTLDVHVPDPYDAASHGLTAAP